MKHVFIINPKAGSKNQSLLIDTIKDVFKEEEYYIENTTRPNEATDIALRYAKSGHEMIIYACGGDGTLHEVVNGVVGYENVKLAVIPIGTGNDFVKAFYSEYTKEDFLNLKYYLNPLFSKCDVVDVEGEYAINTISVGFDVEVGAGIDKYRKFAFNNDTVPYVLSLLSNFTKSLGFEFNLVLDGKATGMNEYSFVVAGNGKYYGGGFKPCPMASMNDGFLDVCIIKRIKHIQIPQLIGSYKKGTHIKYDQLVKVERVKKLQIIAKDKVLINLDGETRKYLNPVIELKEGMLTLCLPNKGEI